MNRGVYDKELMSSYFMELMETLPADGFCSEANCNYWKKEEDGYYCDSYSWMDCPRIMDAFLSNLSEAQQNYGK